MKANEAPENIYVSNYSSGLTYNWHNDRLAVNDVEYTRTDTFIQKVVNFMKKIEDVDEYTWYNEEEHAVGITEKCIEDFKNYMKEE